MNTCGLYSHVSLLIGNNGFAIADEDQVTPGQLSPQQDAAISLPASLFQIITDREDVGIFFALYNTSTLFPVNGGRNRSDSVQRKVGSYILATTVGLGLNFQNLTENVTIVFRQIVRVCMHAYIRIHHADIYGRFWCLYYSLQH